MRGFRLRLDDYLLPVQAYFNCWPEEDYLEMLRRSAVGIESTYNEIGWSWCNGEDPAPSGLREVLFFVAGEEVAVSPKDAVTYFRAATEAWISDHPTHRKEATGLLILLEELFESPVVPGR